MANKQKVETEVKIKIENFDKFLSDLISKGAVFKGKDFQKTIRMDTPNFDLEKRKMFLRVRSGLGNTVTLKIRKEENKNYKIRNEHETKVGDINMMVKIFSILGFSKSFIFEKYRADFKHKNVKISLDELPFGIYAEFEGNEKDINLTLKEFGFNKNKRIISTYWFLFDEYNKEHNLTGKHIIFPKYFKSKIMQTDFTQLSTG